MMGFFRFLIANKGDANIFDWFVVWWFAQEPELFEVLKYADKIASIQKDKLLIKL